MKTVTPSYYVEYQTTQGWVRMRPPLDTLEGAERAAKFVQWSNRLCPHRVVKCVVTVEEKVACVIPALGPVPPDEPIYSMRIDANGNEVREVTPRS